MKSTYDDIRKYFKDQPEVLNNLEVFIKAKEKFLQTEDIQDRISMKMAYVDIYEDIKVQILYGRRKDERLFLSFKECLQKM